MKMMEGKGQISSSKGAITVYLCIILLCSLAVIGVLIDAVRIMCVGNRINSALEASLRSVLAGYSSGLASDCGIFGLEIGSGKAQADYFEYLNKNLNAGSGLLKYEIDNTGTEIKGFEWISGDRSLKSQIIEYMKYRVPLSAARSIIDRFKQAGLPEKAEKAQKASSLRKDRSRIIKEINSLNGKIRNANTFGNIRLENCSELEKNLDSLKSFARQVESEVSGYTALESQQGGSVNNNSGNEYSGTGPRFHSLYSAIDENFRKISELRQSVSSSTVKEEMQKEPPSVLMTRLSELNWDEPLNNELPPAADGNGRNAVALLNGFYDIYKKYSVRIDPKWLISSEEIKRNDELDHNMSVNMDAEPDFREAKAEETNDNVLTFVKKLLDKVEKAAQDGMENIYINEYIMGQFSYVTSRQNIGHLLEKGEVEYILFGSNNQLDNIRKMAERLTFMRFAINSLDYFVNSTNPHPVYRLIYALARGLIQTGKDMLGLYRGKAIDLAPSASRASSLLKMDYADYLRLFLLLQPESEKLYGIKQLVQFNMKQHDNRFELTDYSAAVNAKIRVKVNLWFIPLFLPDKIKLGPFEDKCFVIEQQIYKGY